MAHQMEEIIKRCTETVDHVSKQELPKFIWRDCAGVAIFNITEVGFILSVGEGDGVLVKNNKDGTWSAPSALMFDSASAGAVFGKGNKQLIIFPMTEYGFKQLTANTKYQLGAQVGLAAGSMGRESAITVDAGGHGVGATLYYVFEEGAFMSIGINNSFISAVPDLNVPFYAKPGVTPDEITIDGNVEIPKGRGVEELQAKLSELSAKKE
jgi:lipid-binding SYLF domain-containing protein